MNVIKELELYCKRFGLYERKMENNKEIFDLFDTDRNDGTVGFVILMKDLVKYGSNFLNKNLPKGELVEIYHLIAKMIEFIQSWDIIVEGVYGGGDINNESSYKRIKTAATSPFEMYGYIRNLHYDPTQCILHRFDRLFLSAIKEAKMYGYRSEDQMTDLLGIMDLRNNDFFLYLDLIYPYFDTKIIGDLKKFFRIYAIIDLFLDDITDISDDYNRSAFNSLTWLFKQNYPDEEILSSKHLNEVVIDHGIIDIVYGIITDLERKCRIILNKRKNTLYGFLDFLLSAEITGLQIFKKHGYFMDYIGHGLYDDTKDLLLKPYPWTTQSYNEFASKQNV